MTNCLLQTSPKESVSMEKTFTNLRFAADVALFNEKKKTQNKWKKHLNSLNLA